MSCGPCRFAEPPFAMAIAIRCEASTSRSDSLISYLPSDIHRGASINDMLTCLIYKSSWHFEHDVREEAMVNTR